MKDAEDGWKKAISYSKIALSVAPDGPSSLIVKSIGGAPAAQQRESKWPDRPTCLRIQSALNEAWIAGDPWSKWPQSKGRYMPELIARRFDVPVKIGEEIMVSWLANDAIKEDIRDAHSKKKGLKVTGSIE